MTSTELLALVVDGEITLTEALRRGFDAAQVLSVPDEGWDLDDHDVVVPSLSETLAVFR